MYQRQRGRNNDFKENTSHHSIWDTKPECRNHVGTSDTFDLSFITTEVKHEPNSESTDMVVEDVQVGKASTKEQDIYAGADEEDLYNVDVKCESQLLTNTIIKDELIIESESEVLEANEFDTDTTSTPENYEKQTFKKRRERVYKNWQQHSVFQQESEALDVINNERIWTKYTTNRNKTSNKVIYRCRNVKSKGQQCDAGIYLLYSHLDPCVTLFRSTNKHTCDSIDTKRKRRGKRSSNLSAINAKNESKNNRLENSENQKALVRRLKTIKNWQKEKTFESEEDALAAVKNEQTWSKQTTNKTLKGNKVIYRCRNVKSKGPQCEAGVYLLYSHLDPNINLYRSVNKHTCHEIESKRKPYVRHKVETKIKIESEKLQENQIGLRRRKKVIKNWKKEKCFELESQALEAVRFEQTWTKHTTNKTNRGKKVIYRCKNVKSKGQQCNAGIYLFYSSDGSVTIYRSANEHNCDKIESKSKSTLNDEAKLIIRTEYEGGSKPKYILSVLIANGFNCKQMQVNNYLAQLRRSTFITSNDFSNAFDHQTMEMLYNENYTEN